MGWGYPGAYLFARRWSGFVSAIWLMQFSGSFCFSIYSAALKQVLRINQEQLNHLSVAKDLGDALGVIAGVMSDYVPASALLVIGAAVGFVGYGVQWLVVSQIIDPLPYWVMFVVALMAGNSVPWMNTSVFTMSVKNFPANRGPVVGLYKAYMGLTAAVFSELTAALFSSSSRKLLLLLTVLPSGMCLLTAACLRQLPPAEARVEQKQEAKCMAMLNTAAISLALFLCFADLYTPTAGVAARLLATLFLLILAAPMVVPVFVFFTTHADGLEAAMDAPKDKDGAAAAEQPLLEEEEEEEGAPCPSKGLCLGEDCSTRQVLKRWDFLLFYVSCFCGIGAGVTFSNNLGQIVLAMGAGDVTLVTSLFSVGNFFGRIISGNASELFLRRAALPRSVWMGLSKLPMIAAFVWLAVGSEASLYAGSIILGLCLGLHITVMIPIVSEFYGLKYFGTNYMVSTTCLLAGSLVFSGLIAGKLYDLEAWKQSAGMATLSCAGKSCYGGTFMILIAALIVGACADAILTYLSRGLYQRIHHNPPVSN